MGAGLKIFSVVPKTTYSLGEAELAVSMEMYKCGFIFVLSSVRNAWVPFMKSCLNT